MLSDTRKHTFIKREYYHQVTEGRQYVLKFVCIKKADLNKCLSHFLNMVSLLSVATARATKLLPLESVRKREGFKQCIKLKDVNPKFKAETISGRKL